MDAFSLTIGLSMTAAALLMIGTSLPMAMGRTRRNRWYGVRLTASLSSDEAWDAINRYGGRQLILAAVPVLIAGVVVLFLPMTPHPLLVLLSPVVVLVSLLFAVVRIVMFDADYERAARHAESFYDRPLRSKQKARS